MPEIKINKVLNSCAISICHLPPSENKFSTLKDLNFPTQRSYSAKFTIYTITRLSKENDYFEKLWQKGTSSSFSTFSQMSFATNNPLSLTSLFSIFPGKLWNLIRKLTYSSMKYQQFLLPKIRKVWPVWSIQWSQKLQPITHPSNKFLKKCANFKLLKFSLRRLFVFTFEKECCAHFATILIKRVDFNFMERTLSSSWEYGTQEMEIGEWAKISFCQGLER